MNHAQIDHLLQVTATRPELFVGAGRGRDAAPSFDNHFREANAASNGMTPARPSPPTTATGPAGAAIASSTASAARSGGSQQDADQPAQDKAAASAASDAAADDDARLTKPTAETAADAEDDLEDSSEVVALLSTMPVVESVAGDSEYAASSTDAPETEPQILSGRQERLDGEKSSAASQVRSTLNMPLDGQLGGETLQNSAEAALENQSNNPAETTAELANNESFAAPGAEDAESSTRSRPNKKDPAEHVASATGAPDQDAVDGETRSQSTATSAAQAFAKPTTIDRRESKNRSAKESSARSDTPPGAAAAQGERQAAVPQSSDAAGPAVAHLASPQVAEQSAASASAAATKASATSEAKPGLLSSLNRLDRAGHSSRGANRAGQTDSTSHVDPARFVSRVARAVQTAHERGGPLHLRLSPPELGAMRMELSVNQGTLTATIETDNQIAKQVLLDNLPALRDRLAEQNIKVERFDVDVRRDSTGGQHQQSDAPQNRDQSQRQSSTSGNQPGARRTAAAATLDEPSPLRRTISNTSINVVA